MAKNKALPYILFGVPLLVGIYFVYRGLIKPKASNVEAPKGEDTPTTTTTTTTTSGTSTPTYSSQDKLPFKKGMQSNYIKNIQDKLGISSDGKFGNQTYASVVAFQKKNGLSADGIVGAKTWKALFGVDFPKVGTTSVQGKLSGNLASNDFRVGQSFNPLWV
jgi:hypothetical protein